MSVAAITSRPVVTIEMDDPLSVVKEIFDNVQFHHLLVVEKGKLFGVIFDRDLFKALSRNLGTALKNPPIRPHSIKKPTRSCPATPSASISPSW